MLNLNSKKQMKKFIYSLGLLMSVSAFVSCDKDLQEINKSPNSPEVAATSGIFNDATKYFVDNTRGTFPSGRMALPWIQMSSQRNYNSEDLYIFRVGVNNSLYHNIQLTVSKYKSMIRICEDPELAGLWAGTYGDIQNQIAAARIMIAYAQHELVGLYGDVSYYSYGSDDPDFQGQTKGEDIVYSTPVFAPQEKIYKDLMKELKEASEQINLTTSKVMDGDAIFGTPLKMKRFANSLRLRIANRVKHVIPEANAHIADAIASGVMESNADNVGLKYQNDVIHPAPWFNDAFVGNRNDFAPTNTLVNLLKGETGPFGEVDPRLYVFVAPVGTSFFKVPPKEGMPPIYSVEDQDYPLLYEKKDLDKFIGAPYGISTDLVYSQAQLASQYGSFIYKADYKEIYMEYAEVAFLLSENKNWDNTEFKNGVQASMEKFGVPENQIKDYLATLPAASMETVITQKYLSLFMQPNEAWAEYRRTKFPDVLLLPGQQAMTIADLEDNSPSVPYTFNAGKDMKIIPERITYPADLQSLNKDNLAAAIEKLEGGDLMSSKLIFAK